jgi:hypothetical protein
MWKIYNHHYLSHRSAAKVLNLFFYALYVYVMTYMLAHLPVPARMLRHQEAVSDLLLGEEFDSETTHIFKNFDDVMTAEEMWQWAQGPLSAGLLVEGEADGNLAALLGTNWLLGPVRLRQERSWEKPADCTKKLSSSFGSDYGQRLSNRGIKCTNDWQQGNSNKENTSTAFLDLSQPLETLDGKSFIEAFPEWYNEHALANRPEKKDSAYCCSQSGCFANRKEQEEKITRDEDDMFEWACSVDLEKNMLTPNPSGAYRSSIKSDPTETANLWAKFQEFGSGGFHIDLSGNSTTFVKQLKALEELQFVDQFTRSLTFQFIILNGNTFSVGRESLFSKTMTVNDDSTVIVGADINFVFSPSGHVKSYDRIASMQLKPLAFLGIGLTDAAEEEENGTARGTFFQLAMAVVPFWMALQEFQQLNAEGVMKWIKSGWNWFEIAYIVAMYMFCRKTLDFIDEEHHFLLQYKINAQAEYDGVDEGAGADVSINTQDLFNDVLPLRASYKAMIKYLGMVALVVVFKFFKYMKIFRSTTLLWNTLQLASGQLLVYTALMGWVIFAFSLCVTLMWGHESTSFQNIPSSAFQLVRLAAGESDMEYAELKRGDATVTPFVYLAFLFLVAILGMNLMIAIVTDFYEEARDTMRSYEIDYTWIQDIFCGAYHYDDFYRGKGLWNEPVSENVTGSIGEAIQALRGSWRVKPIPMGCGPRKWNSVTKEVQALGETQAYPFMLQRSSRIQLRYRVESHEHNAFAAANAAADAQAEQASGGGGGGGSTRQIPTIADPTGRSSTSHLMLKKRVSMMSLSSPEKDGAQEDEEEDEAGETTMLDSARSAMQHTMKSTMQKTMSTISSARAEVEHLARNASIVTNGKNVTAVFAADLDQKIDDNSPYGDTGAHELPSLDLWMAASTLAQYRGIRYLEQLEGRRDKYRIKHNLPHDQHVDDKVIADSKLTGDLITLKTPAEGGLMGEITLEFVEFKPVRRASREDKQKLAREIEHAREALHDLKVEYEEKRQSALDKSVEMHVELHMERLQQQDAAAAPAAAAAAAAAGAMSDAEHLTPLCPGCSSETCEQCTTKANYRQKIAEMEGQLQNLHVQRGELEGVERNMVFNVVDVDAWQKFRPLTVNQGHLGEQLKEACLECMHDKLRRGVSGTSPADSDTASTSTGFASPRTEREREHEDSFAAQYKDDADQHKISKEAVIKVVTNAVLGGVKRQWAGLDAATQAKHTETIEREIDKIITDMATEEQEIKKSHGVAAEAMRKRAGWCGWLRGSSMGCGCVSGAQGHNVQATKATIETMTALDEGECNLDLLVPNYDVAHPTVSSAMNRLMKKAQRIQEAECEAHTPLLEVKENAEFEFDVPMMLQLQIVKRSAAQFLSGAQLKRMFSWLLPFNFIMSHMYFHSSVEDDVEDFLEAKCLRAEGRMSKTVKRSLKLQMREFMSPEHSIPLGDFVYQLQYFVFKVKSKTKVARLRSWFHETFRSCSWMRQCFVGLTIPMRRHYSQLEEEIAMHYLLTQYNDFVDRRCGSIPGDPFHSGGVLLDQTTRDALEKAYRQAEEEDGDAHDLDHADAVEADTTTTTTSTTTSAEGSGSGSGGDETAAAAAARSRTEPPAAAAAVAAVADSTEALKLLQGLQALAPLLEATAKKNLAAAAAAAAAAAPQAEEGVPATAGTAASEPEPEPEMATTPAAAAAAAAVRGFKAPEY